MIDYGQDTLWGKKIISTINYDEQEIIRDILFLHGNGSGIDCDPTYSTGNFYKNGLSKPKYRFDKEPQSKEVIKATSDNLPLENECINTIIFDPPFIISGGSYNEAKEGSCIIAKRFTIFESFDELKEMYSGSLKEFSRILKPEGIVIFKCQDTIASSIQYFSHVWVMYEAIKHGFYPKDLFILLAKARLIDGRKQQHGRKFHCFFWVFKKEINRVEY